MFFADEFGESQIYRLRFIHLHKCVLEIPNFAGKHEERRAIGNDTRLPGFINGNSRNPLAFEVN